MMLYLKRFTSEKKEKDKVAYFKRLSRGFFYLKKKEKKKVSTVLS